MKLTFNEPYEFEGKKYESLEVPIDDLSGKELRRLHKEYVASKTGAVEKITASNLLVTVSGDPDFLIFVMASVSKHPIEFFEDLPSREYLSVIAQASSFFIG